MKTIRHILKQKGKEIWSAQPTMTVFDALRIMAEKDIGAIPVLDGKGLVGIFSERDYARKVILKGKASRDVLVRDIMSTHLVTVTPDQTNEMGLELMTEKHVRHLPVVQGKKMVGFISIGDLVKSIIEEQNQVIDKLGKHIQEGTGRY
jgi:CBS domain-containing protein